MKKFKFFVILLIFSLSVVGSSLLFSPISFANAEDTGDMKPPVPVYNNNAQEVFSQPWLYSKITLMEDITSSITVQAQTSSQIFDGILDGNGYSINTINYSSNGSGSYLGLIPYAKGATIKNLKIGASNFNFEKDFSDELYMGIIVGCAENTSIESCQIEIGSIEISLNEGPIVFGSVVGYSSSSTITNIVEYADLDFDIISNASQIIGGVVGCLSSSSISKTLYFGNINLTGVEDNGKNIYCGGLVGIAQNSSTTIKDNAFSGLIESNVVNNIGAILGKVDGTSSGIGSINYNYWTANLNAIGVNGENYNNNSHLKKVDAITDDLLRDNSLFDGLSSGFDFYSTFCEVGSKIKLQRFEKFNLSFASNRDKIIKDIKFVVNGTELDSYESKYGEEIKIKITLNEYVKNDVKIENLSSFYRIIDVLVSNSSILNNLEQNIVQTQDGFEFTFLANASTSGQFSIKFSANLYSYEICVAQIDNTYPGYLSSSNYSSQDTVSLKSQCTITSSMITIYALPKEQSYYLFSHWNLYYYENGKEVLQDQTNEKWWNSSYRNLATLKINFGQSPFNQNFKLEAVFSSEGGIDVNLINIDTNSINLISIQGNIYDNKPIKISKFLNNAEIKVVTEKGYDFDIDVFVQNLSKLYGSVVSEEEVLKDITLNDDGTKEYTLSVDVAKIYNNEKTESINLQFPTVQSVDGEGNSLLWLWITLPSVLALGVIIFLIVYIKKRNIAKNNVKKKREANYKDFYT